MNALEFILTWFSSSLYVQIIIFVLGVTLLFLGQKVSTNRLIGIAIKGVGGSILFAFSPFILMFIYQILPNIAFEDGYGAVGMLVILTFPLGGFGFVVFTTFLFYLLIKNIISE